MALATKKTTVVTPPPVRVFCLGRSTPSSRLEVPAEHWKPWVRLVYHEWPETLEFNLSTLIGWTNSDFLLEASLLELKCDTAGKILVIPGSCISQDD